MSTDIKAGPVGPVVAKTGSVALDAADCAGASVTFQTVTIPGVAAGDGVLLFPPAAGIGALSIGAGFGTAANTASVPFSNPAVGAVNPGLLTYKFVVFK